MYSHLMGPIKYPIVQKRHSIRLFVLSLKVNNAIYNGAPIAFRENLWQVERQIMRGRNKGMVRQPTRWE
eukprot:c34716_g1_i1 orf=2-205(-)